MLMKNSVSKRIDKSISYQFLAYGYFNKLVNVCGIENFDLNNYTDSCILNIAKREGQKVSNEDMDEIVDWAIFAIGETYGYTKGDYVDMINSAIIPASKMEKIYNQDNPFKYINDTNFLVSNNFLLTRYPEFYNSQILGTLDLISSYYDKEEFSRKEEWYRFKKARRVLIKNLEKYVDKNSKKKAKKISVDIIRYKM